MIETFQELYQSGLEIIQQYRLNPNNVINSLKIISVSGVLLAGVLYMKTKKDERNSINRLYEEFVINRLEKTIEGDKENGIIN
jgi:hypothetical protein|tara:strand:+ start:6674 stop:6922 length:249 start_codon:yes stop_codon:yes gene_type:complete